MCASQVLEAVLVPYRVRTSWGKRDSSRLRLRLHSISRRRGLYSLGPVLHTECSSDTHLSDFLAFVLVQLYEWVCTS